MARNIKRKQVRIIDYHSYLSNTIIKVVRVDERKNVYSKVCPLFLESRVGRWEGVLVLLTYTWQIPIHV